MRKTIFLDEITKCDVKTQGETIEIMFKLKKLFWWERMNDYQFIINILPEEQPIKDTIKLTLYSISSGYYWHNEIYSLGEFDLDKKINEVYGIISKKRKESEIIKNEIKNLVQG